MLFVAWLGTALLTRPLTYGSFYWYDLETAEKHDPFEPGTDLIYRHHNEGAIHLALRNGGFLPVTINDVSVFPAAGDEMRASLIRQTGTIVDRESNLTDRMYGQISDGSDLSLSSITFDGGREHEVRVEVRFDDCREYQPGTGLGFDRMYVKHSILGIPRQAEVMLMDEIWVRSPERRDCPRD